jgi:hypothetical protein
VRITLVILLDLAMLGVGGYLIKSYLDGRQPQAKSQPAPKSSSDVVEVLPPSQVQTRQSPPAAKANPADSRGDKAVATAQPTKAASRKLEKNNQAAARPAASAPTKPTAEPAKPAEPEASLAKSAEPALPADDQPVAGSGPPGQDGPPGQTGLIEPYPPPGVDATADGTREAPGEEVQRVAAQISRVVERNRVTLARCYQRAAKGHGADSALEGRIEVRLSVTGTGGAANVRVVSNDTGSDVLGSCVVAEVRGWSFPAHGFRPIEYVWPFVFHPPN